MENSAMKRMRGLVVSAACASILVSPVFAAKLPSPEATARSFYAWYIPQAMTDDGRPAWQELLRQRPFVLSSALRLALASDLKKEAHASGTIEGIDFDPFLGGQDPCPRFAIGKTRKARRHYIVSIKLSCAPGADPPPIKVSFILVASRFVIDDVRYAEKDTLRRALGMRLLPSR